MMTHTKNTEVHTMTKVVPDPIKAHYQNLTMLGKQKEVLLELHNVVKNDSPIGEGSKEIKRTERYYDGETYSTGLTYKTRINQHLATIVENTITYYWKSGKYVLETKISTEVTDQDDWTYTHEVVDK